MIIMFGSVPLVHVEPDDEDEEDLGMSSEIFLDIISKIILSRYSFLCNLLHLRLLLKAVTSKVTIVEKEKFDVEKKVVTVTDKFRTVEKILSCDNLEDFLIQGGYFNLISHIAVLVPFLSGAADSAGNEPSRSLNFTIREEAPTRAFSWLSQSSRRLVCSSSGGCETLDSSHPPTISNFLMRHFPRTFPERRILSHLFSILHNTHIHFTFLSVNI